LRLPISCSHQNLKGPILRDLFVKCRKIGILAAIAPRTALACPLGTLARFVDFGSSPVNKGLSDVCGSRSFVACTTEVAWVYVHAFLPNLDRSPKSHLSRRALKIRAITHFSPKSTNPYFTGFYECTKRTQKSILLFVVFSSKSDRRAPHAPA
jgi:hypothetical protein